MYNINSGLCCLQVYLAEFSDKDDQVILDTQWFTTEIIGPTFAGEEFVPQLEILPYQPCYTRQQLCDFFPTGMDISQLLALLDHMDLVHETSDKKYLLPGKLPVDIPEIGWNVTDTYDVKGMSIECTEVVDIFNPNVFPLVQKKILDDHKETSRISRSAIEFVVSSIRVVVQLTKHKRAINIAATVPDKDSAYASYQSLQDVVDLIQKELCERSPGTNVKVKYISQRSLKTSKNLEKVITYDRETLIKAEQENGIIVHNGKPEVVSKILFQGYDNMFLDEFGSECSYEWLPVDNLKRCFTNALDRLDERMEDYRFVAKILGIDQCNMEQIAENSRRRDESPTVNLIKKWCHDNGRKMTLGMFHSLLMQLSLVVKVDSVKAIEEVLGKYQSKVRSFWLTIMQRL